MTVTMTAKNQITIPKKITDVLRLRKGAMFEVEVANDKIELIPLEVKRVEFSDDIYEKLEVLSKKEKGKEKRVTKKFTDSLKRGK
ncbi:MAG: AbrB/MazE/SpoVT family DNA-binding domain-containing protein [Candidatus Omnitrophica bacterium]|nr:AbrB/MazE/SpoVT family DNA-binding domain-containing protein [Candidatus Omnitrophota bacterium]MBU4149178.1 AbrB/MazE/SpoVT family DNA-binding domain-containing protein [Candidatus Omnitrophota bacterium]